MTTIAPAKSTSKPAPTFTRRMKDGTIFALSSDGVSEYKLTLSPAFCICKGFSYRSRCRHLEAARARYGEPQGCPVCALSPLGLCPSCAAATTKKVFTEVPSWTCIANLYEGCTCPRCAPKGA